MFWGWDAKNNNKKSVKNPKPPPRWLWATSHRLTDRTQRTRLVTLSPHRMSGSRVLGSHRDSCRPGPACCCCYYCCLLVARQGRGRPHHRAAQPLTLLKSLVDPQGLGRCWQFPWRCSRFWGQSPCPSGPVANLRRPSGWPWSACSMFLTCACVCSRDTLHRFH